MSRAFWAITVVIAMALPLGAQWVKYPTAKVPRTKSGAVNLTAPAPRTLDGKPDLSGIWKPEDNRPCPAAGCNDMVVSQEFVDIGWAIKGGLPYQPWAAALTKQRTAENRLNDPNSRCLPTGIVRMHTTPLFRKVVQTPSLVVQSNGFRDGLWLDSNGSPLTDAATITERIRRPNYGTLEIALRVDDPKAYTKPWETTLKQVIVLNSELLDYVCYENEKSVEHFKK